MHKVVSCLLLFSFFPTLPFVSTSRSCTDVPKNSPEWGNLSPSAFYCFVHLEITLCMLGHNSTYHMDSSQPSRKGWTQPQWPAGTSQGCPGCWWIHHCGGTHLGKAKPGKEQARIRLELVNSWIPQPREVPWHCSNFPASSVALFRHRGFTPGNVYVVEVAITPHKGLSCYLMTEKTVFESFFGNLNTQGYICSFLQGAELLCWSILDEIAACSALALLILFLIVVSPSFPSKKVGLSFHSFLYFSSTSF